jgi:hypothetical protein
MALARPGPRLLVLAGLVLAAIVGVGISSPEWGRGWTEAKVRRLIRTEVPRSSTKTALEGWFDRHGITHGAVRGDTRGGSIGDQTFRELAGLREEDVDEIVFGEIEAPDANVSWVFSGRIDIVFFFKQGRCVGHWVSSFTYEL